MGKNEKSIFFTSDFHLGADFEMSSAEREKKVVRWLESIQSRARAIYLVGDTFDYWFEYRYVIPKGYSRFFAQLTRMIDDGIEVHFIKGNHDMWVFDYFQNEIGMLVHDHFVQSEWDGKTFYITHGDGLGNTDKSYLFIRRILRNKWAQSIFASLHPSLGIPLMRWTSRKSRIKSATLDLEKQLSGMLEFLESFFADQSIDFFICGHIHQPIKREMKSGRITFCNLGDWIDNFSYAEWDGNELCLKTFD